MGLIIIGCDMIPNDNEQNNEQGNGGNNGYVVENEYNEHGYNALGWHQDENIVNNFYTDAPWCLEGKDRHGNKYYDHEGHDWKGFHKDTGWHKDTEVKTNGHTGTHYDHDGYDRDGWDKNGFNREHINKTTGTHYDNDGHDYKGNDKFGINKSVAPANKYPMNNINNVTSQSDVNFAMQNNKVLLQAQTNLVKNQFANAPITNANKKFMDFVVAQCGEMIVDSTQFTGDRLLWHGVVGTSRIINVMALEMPAGKERNDFEIIMNIFRNQEYLHGRKINDHISPAATELNGYYHDLGEPVGTINPDYIQNTLVPKLSQELNISKTLVMSLLNQIATWEYAWASNDDIRAKGFNPITASNSLADPTEYFADRKDDDYTGMYLIQAKQYVISNYYNGITP